MPAIEITFNQIKFDPQVQSYCCNPKFKCPNYRHSWACPPEAPYLEEKVATFKKFFLIYVKFDLNEYVKQVKAKKPKKEREKIINSFYRKDLLRDALEKEILNFLDNYQNNYRDRLVLWDGFCRICYKENKKCTYDSGKPCRYPDRIRYSIEAVGINVDQTVKNVGINLEWPPTNYGYRFALVCFK
jgi:predicted metal-binding protein